MAQILHQGGCHDAIRARPDGPCPARHRDRSPGGLPAVRDPARVRPRREPAADRHAVDARARLRQVAAATAPPEWRPRRPAAATVAPPARVPERRRGPEPVPEDRERDVLLLSRPADLRPSPLPSFFTRIFSLRWIEQFGTRG